MLGTSGDPPRGAPERARTAPWAVAASLFAGVLGGGVIDAALVLSRAPGTPRLEVAALALGLYGTLGLVLAALAGGATYVVLGAIPGGLRRLVDDRRFDTQIAAAVLAIVGGGAGLAAPRAPGPAPFVGRKARPPPAGGAPPRGPPAP